MDKLNFESLPTLVHDISTKIDNLEKLIRNSQEAASINDDVLNISQAAKFLNLTQSALRAKISRKDIPYSKSGKRIFFLRTTLLEWIRNKTVLTKTETEELAFNHIAERRTR